MAKEKRLRVGDKVRFYFGNVWVTTVIREDRGSLGVGGRRLYGSKFNFDPPGHMPEDMYLELPAEELELLPKQPVP